jgi:hypothetical protein
MPGPEQEKLKIIFNQVIKSPTGYLLRVRTERKTKKLFTTIEGKTKIEVNELHQQLGHPNHTYTLETAKMYD